jgi:AraC-like DNA-binding protein
MPSYFHSFDPFFIIFDTMLYLLLNLLTAFLALGALTVSLVFLKKQESNYYFLFILLFLTIQRFIYSITFLFEFETHLSFSNSSFAYFIIPIFFLFFKKYFGNQITHKENLYHLSLATCFFLLHVFFDIDQLFKPFLYFIFSSAYMIALLKKFLNIYYVKKGKWLLKSQKKWSMIMLFLVSLLYVTSNLLIFKYISDTSVILQKFYNITAIFWLVSLTYLFLNPEILFGKEKLKKIVRKEELTPGIIWLSKPNKKIKEKDKNLKDKLAINSMDIISKIESYIEEHYSTKFESLNFDSLSTGTAIQPYHLNYIFKYYCKFSKNDFFNYYKIMHALTLIEAGYLQNKTINSLVTDSHFKSKKTFYNNFNKFTGKNPYEINKLVKFRM